MDKTKEKSFICDDMPIPISETIKNMTDEEIDEEFEKRFGFYLESGAQNDR